MNKKKLLLTAAALSGALAMSAAVTPLWLRDVKISPDGSRIAFTYKGDIYTVPTAGGTATRITVAPSYESVPIWSPDSKKIAFASDRNGNMDVFVVDAQGGTPTRLTFNSAKETPESFSPDGSNVYFSAAIQDPASSAMFPSSIMTELYSVPVKGGAPQQVLATPAQMMSWGSDKAKNGWFLYQDIKGFEDEWRKHHTSSVTRDIWKYDAAAGRHTNLTDRAGEDRNPVVAGQDFYFLSERDGGSMNVYKAPLANPADAKAVTSFKTHPVRFLSRAADGTLAFTYDGEIYTLAPNTTKPAKVAITVIDEDYARPERLSVRSGARNIAPAPDGKAVAFVYRGDVFVTSTEYPTTKQITSTPEAEHDLEWSPDGKTLYYTSERNGHVNIYKATMGREDDLNFPNATVIKEEPVFKESDTEYMVPMISPDGKKIAYIVDRNRLMVRDLKGGSAKQLNNADHNPSRSMGFNFSWSPDSKWILSEVIDRKHDPYSDVALYNVETGEMTDLTNTGYFAEGARFVLDGNAVLYLTDRYGMRNHASWGSETDAVLVFLNQDAYDRFRLSEEDYALRKELDKKAEKAKKKAEEKDKKKDKKDADKKDGDDSKKKDIVVELEGIEDRVVRLTPHSSDMSDAIIDADGKNLYYLSSGQKGTQLWKLGLRDDDSHSVVSNVSGAHSFAPSVDGKSIFVYGRNIQKLDPKSDKLKNVTYNGTMMLDRAAEREFMYDYMTREEGKRFYNTNMHGIDWPAMTAHYRKFLPHINNNYDFAEMFSEILGELNVSHTGGRYRPFGDLSADRTAALGLLYDMTYTGDGLRVDEVLVGGPFDRHGSAMGPGAVVTAINGQPLKAGEDIDAIFNGLSGKKTLVTFKDAAGKEQQEVVLPISHGNESDLLYKRWVKQRAADVDRWSGGRLGYVHIESMDDDSFRKAYSDILGKYNDREGIVIDIRWNGGGRLHEDLEVFFTGKKYLTQVIRGVEACDMPSRRWNKPSIMVMSEACYSNAHGSPWVYKHQGIGKLVGAPVPGTMTSVNWVTCQDPTMVFGIPVIGYRTAEGTYLENSQLEPDVKVFNSPETIVKGEDTQLRTAVETLLRDLPAKK